VSDRVKNRLGDKRFGQKNIDEKSLKNNDLRMSSI